MTQNKAIYVLAFIFSGKDDKASFNAIPSLIIMLKKVMLYFFNSVEKLKQQKPFAFSGQRITQ